MSEKLGTVHDRRRSASEHNYRVAEIKRLLGEGIAISKIAKMLGIKYQLAKTLATLGE